VQPVEIVPASSRWAEEFQRLARPVCAELRELALRIDHIGSTSVPGLAAKDIIDVQVAVNALDVDQLAPAFARGGFRLRPGNPGNHRPPRAEGPDQYWTNLFFTEITGRANVHVRVINRPNQRYALLFRDYLRAQPQAARLTQN
jgi:GrpB-like predicted nucleotidyltransferase (UPF0157 family)